MVWWLGLSTFTAVAWVQSLVWELRSHTKPPTAEAKKKKKKKKKKRVSTTSYPPIGKARELHSGHNSFNKEVKMRSSVIHTCENQTKLVLDTVCVYDRGAVQAM